MSTRSSITDALEGMVPLPPLSTRSSTTEALEGRAPVPSPRNDELSRLQSHIE